MRRVLLVAVWLVVAACSAGPAPTPGPDRPATGLPTPRLPSSAPAAGLGSLADLPPGPPPRLGYADGEVFHHSDGSETRLPGARASGVSGVVVTGAGLLVSDQRHFEGSNGLRLVDGGVTTLGPCTSGTGATEAGRAAWVTFGCPESGVAVPAVLHVLDDEGRETTYALGPQRGSSATLAVAGFLDGDVVVEGALGRGGVTLHDADGRVRRVPGVLGARSVDEVGGLLVGYLPGAVDVTGVVDSRDGRVLWRTRDDVRAFSPDGALLVRHGRADVVTIAAARTGATRATLDVPAGVDLTGFAWEDDRHLLAVATLDGTQAVVRFDRRGRAERTTPVVRVRTGPWGTVTLLLESQE